MIQSWIFSIITPVFSVTWSFRNYYNIAAQKTFIIIIIIIIINNVENIFVFDQYFCENPDTYV